MRKESLRIKVSEMFESIQGEGRFVGEPMLFIRVSGCTRRCRFCDSKYVWSGGTWQTFEEVVERVRKDRLKYVCFTGGEPLLYKEFLYKLMSVFGRGIKFHLESNGDLLNRRDIKEFDYLCISPKTAKEAKRVRELLEYVPGYKWDIKIVVGLGRIGDKLIPYGTMLMALTTGDERRDLKTKMWVWKYCVYNRLRYSSRLQRDVWGKEKGV